MRKLGFLIMLVAGFNLMAQTPAKDADTVQALLVEVRQLRQDIEAMTVASQRVQIALYALQLQDAAVAGSAQRLDNAKNKCSGVEEHRNHAVSEVQRFENALALGKLSEVETKDVQIRLGQAKSEAEAVAVEAQSCQANEAEVSGQFRTEQAKMTELQDRIERLDKGLAALGGTR